MEMFVSKDGKFVVDYEVFEHHTDFKVFEYGNDVSERLEHVISGSVKWDCCSNWDCSPEGVMLHFCGTDDIKSVHDVMMECYDVASKVMEKWDG